MPIAVLLWMSAAALAGQEMASAAPVAGDGIRVLAAQFGTLGRANRLDITGPVQALCGEADSCSLFCSESSFGRYRLGRRPVCRVTYRCPDRSVRAVEAAAEDLLVLRCAARDPVAASGDEPLQPPPYVAPRG